MARGSLQLVVSVVVVGCFGLIAHGQINGAFDTEPPQLALSHTLWVAGEAPPTLQSSDTPGVGEVKAWLDGQPLSVVEAQPVVPVDLAPGAYELRVVAADSSWSRNRAEATWWLRVVAAPRPLDANVWPHMTR